MASKYRSIPTTVDGIRFDSRKEAARWVELRLLEKARLISGLRRQVKFDLAVNGVKVCAYYADFCYVENGVEIVEDVKSVATMTPVFKIKAKLMRAVLGIQVRTV